MQQPESAILFSCSTSTSLSSNPCAIREVSDFQSNGGIGRGCRPPRWLKSAKGQFSCLRLLADQVWLAAIVFVADEFDQIRIGHDVLVYFYSERRRIDLGSSMVTSISRLP